MCLESFRCGRGHLELQITVIPLLELVFIFTQKLEEVFGAGVLRNSCAGPDTCNHSGVGAGVWSHSRAGVAVVEQVIRVTSEFNHVFVVIPKLE